jgi:4-hydroxybenzoate polyprenyltransferase
MWTLGILINGYIFALNDVVDLPRDRLNPRRRTSALVSGRVSERVALTLALQLPFGAVLAIVLAGWTSGPVAVFIALLALGAVVNVYQKATRCPLAMDMLFAVTMAGPLPVTAWAVTGSVPAVVWLATATLFLLSLELNSVAGNLKDLGSDVGAGFTTVAVSRGARLDTNGALVSGRRYGSYVRRVHALTTAAALVTVGAASVGRPLAVQLGVASLAAGLVAWGARDLRRLLGGSRRPSATGREVWFAAGFALFLVAVALRAPVAAFVAALTALVVWEVVCRPTVLAPLLRRGVPARR